MEKREDMLGERNSRYKDMEVYSFILCSVLYLGGMKIQDLI